MKELLSSIPVLFALVSWSSAAETKPPAASKPNVVFILADDMGFSDAGCYGGKWHVDGKVLSGGFDRSLNMNNQGNYFSAAGNVIDDKPVKPATDESGYYATIAIADHAIECLKDHAANHAGQPFFHYVAFIAPHFPLHALPEDIAKYRDRYLAGWEAMRDARFSRQKEMAIVNTTLSALERNVGPP